MNNRAYCLSYMQLHVLHGNWKEMAAYIFNNLLTFLLCATEINAIWKVYSFWRANTFFFFLFSCWEMCYICMCHCWLALLGSKRHPVLDKNIRIHVPKTVSIFFLNKVMELSIINKAIFYNKYLARYMLNHNISLNEIKMSLALIFHIEILEWINCKNM